MLKLYGGVRSRASIVQWYLEELGVPYEFVLLDMQAGAHRQPDYLAINPMGKVPAIVDGDFKLAESGAILVYLAQKYGKMPQYLEGQAEVIQWVLFSNATLAQGIFSEATREKETPKLLTPLNQILERQPFIMGEDWFSRTCGDNKILCFVGCVRCGDSFDNKPISFNPRRNPPLSVL
jgi:glutathione S-transferase